MYPRGFGDALQLGLVRQRGCNGATEPPRLWRIVETVNALFERRRAQNRGLVHHRNSLAKPRFGVPITMPAEPLGRPGEPSAGNPRAKKKYGRERPGGGRENKGES